MAIFLHMGGSGHAPGSKSLYPKNSVGSSWMHADTAFLTRSSLMPRVGSSSESRFTIVTCFRNLSIDSRGMFGRYGVGAKAPMIVLLLSSFTPLSTRFTRASAGRCPWDSLQHTTRCLMFGFATTFATTFSMPMFSVCSVPAMAAPLSMATCSSLVSSGGILKS